MEQQREMEIPQEEDLIYALDIGTRSVIGMLGKVKEGKVHIFAMEKQPHQQRAMQDGQIEDIGQAARSSLSRIYRDMGDLDAAEAQARACIELAPTSAPAYNDLITCFAEGDHYDRIIDVAREALRVAVTGNDIAYVYYRLAFAYWQTGRLPEALACYLRVPESSPMGEAALRERNDLVSEMGNSVPGSDWDPTACLRTAGVPWPPWTTSWKWWAARSSSSSTRACRWRPPPWRASWPPPSATTSCTPWPPASAKGCKHFLQQDAQEKAQYGPFLITLNLKSPGCAQGSQRGPDRCLSGPQRQA